MVRLNFILEMSYKKRTTFTKEDYIYRTNITGVEQLYLNAVKYTKQRFAHYIKRMH